MNEEIVYAQRNYIYSSLSRKVIEGLKSLVYTMNIVMFIFVCLFVDVIVRNLDIRKVRILENGKINCCFSQQTKEN